MAIKFLNSVNADSGVLYVDAINNRVGIGTTSPTRSLSVESAASSVMADFKYTAGGFSSIILSNTNGSAHLASVGNDFLISPAGTERMRITSAGNVGIGTTGPTQKLEVAGTILQSALLPAPNDDLNDLVGTRYFRSHTGSTNAPLSSFGMGINLEYGSGNSMQLYSDRSSGNALYMRKQSNSSWSNWIRIRDENQISDTDISNWDAGYSRWSGVGGSGDWNNIDENSFIKGHTTTLNYPPDLSQSFLSGIAAMYSTGNGWQLASTRGGSSSLYHRHVSNGTWNNWRRILDSDDIYVDNSNGNVGIGTTSPDQKLHVVGNAKVTGVLYTNTVQTLNGAIIDFRHQDASTIMRVDTTNARVGIGTTAPADKLEVQDGNIRIEQVGNTDAKLIFNPYSSAIGTGYQWELVGSNTTNNYNFQIRENGTTYVTVDSSINGNAGSVGIGTISPAYPLDVNGEMRATAYRIGGGTILSGSSTVQLGSGGATGIITFNTTSGEGMRLSGSNVGIGTTSPQQPLHVVGYGLFEDSGTGNAIRLEPTNGNQQIVTTSGNLNLVADTGRINIYNGTTATRLQMFNGANSTYAVEIKTSGDSYFNGGNVGIGTTSPSQRLHISKTDGSNEFVGLRVENDLGHGEFGTQSNYSRILSNGTLLYAGSPGTTYFYIGQGAGQTTIQTFSYLNGGQVGIGTTSPGDKLEVSGNVYANAFNSVGTLSRYNGTGGIAIAGLAGTPYAYISAYSNSGGAGKSLALQKDGGNVGIGTTSPDQSLTVRGGKITAGITDVQVAMLGADGSNVGFTGTSTNHPFQLRVNNSTKVQVGTDGNVGIGTTSPSYKLDISGTARVNSKLLLDSADYAQHLSLRRGVYGMDFILTGNRLDLSPTASTTELKVLAKIRTTSDLLVDANVQFSAYGAGILKTNASGVVSVDTSTYATQTYVTDAIADLVDSAPATLDTLNELAAALGDDPNFATTVTNSIATKLPLAGGTLTGDLTISKTTPILTFNSSDVLVDQGIVFSNQGNFDASIKHGASSADMIFDIGRNSTWGGAAIFKLDTYQSYRMFRDSHQWSVLGSEKMRVASNGNVGIGTTNPATKLDVVGAVKSSVAFQASVNESIDADNLFNNGIKYGFLFNTAANLPTAGNSHYSNLGNILLTHYDGATTDDFYIRAKSYNGLTSWNKVWTDQNLTNVSQLANDAGYITSAEAGIDQATADTRYVNVTGDTMTGDLIVPNLRSNSIIGSSSLVFSTSGGANIELYGAGNAYYDAVNHVFRSANAASTVMQINTNTGNVGIGTTNPIQKLQVDGNIYSNGGNVYINGDKSFVAVGNMKFETWNGSSYGERMRITDAGQVTIGRTAPYAIGGTAKLSVEGLFTIGAGTTDLAYFRKFGAGNIQIQTYNNGNVGEIQLQPYGGNVGIGTTSPGEKLEVYGKILANNGSSLYIDAAATQTVFASTTSIPMRFQTNSTVRLTIGGSGTVTVHNDLNVNNKVGIGTTSPAAPLHVAPDSNYKVIKLGDDTVSHYKFSGQADHTLTLTCGSYYMAEVVITAAQSNSGGYNNLYIRGIWSNNHTTHHWDVLEEVGYMTNNTISITNTENDVSNSGKLEIVHDYIDGGSFIGMTVRVTDYNGTHSYTIS